MLLAHELVTDTARPDRWMLFLHGILGRRSNWRSFARKWGRRRPGWGAVLVDLRDHGESQGLPGPRTVAAAGADLVPLVEHLTQEQGGRVAGILGHSFGGKVAIAGAAALRAADGPPGLDELWIIDAPPGPRSDERPGLTDQVFAVLRSLPPRFEDRDGFIEQVMGAGIHKMTAQWLATNLVEDRDPTEPSGGRWRFGLELDKIEALLADFARVDLWPAVEAEHASGAQVGLVLGARSEAVHGAELQRAEALAEDGALRLEVVPRAGHWLHVENPAGLLEVLV